ncbi:unnamed protein product [Caenorhabditis angaria]|uniref:Uncharacterized protein n=1 Tax=Caenorhabditis angaria TaxID=860376 RepID=A0A9P1IKD8_9PELO|nr:unnamed protein product [Caenorhabditis angaria]
MNFHDDSQILSNLGILDSHERSPKREETTTQKEKFVDIRLTATVSDSDDSGDDSDTLFDRNVLLSTTKRQNSSLIRGRAENQSIRYFILCLLFLIAGMVSNPQALAKCSLESEIIGCFWICVGMLAGSYAVKILAYRSNLMLYLISSLIILLINLSLFFNFAFFYTIRGFFIGSIFYAAILMWFAFWRKTPRKILIFFMFFSLGAMISMSFNEGFPENDNNNLVVRMKRMAENKIDEKSENKTLLPFSEAQEVTQSSNITEGVKKPEVATGNVQKIKTKTEENAEKIKEIQKEETATPSTSTSTSTTTTTTLPPTTSTTTTKIYYTVAVRSRESHEIPPTISTASTLQQQFCPNATFLLPSQRDFSESAALKMAVAIVLAAFCAAFALCCLPCGYRADSRIRKLETDSIVGLGMRLRLSIAAIQTLIGFSQQLVHFHSKSENHWLSCVLIFATSLVLVFGGSKIGSVGAIVFSTSIFALGQFVMIFSSFSTFATSSTIVGLLMLWISVFLTVEVSLHPRSTVQLAYFLIAWIFGRIFACVFAMDQVLGELG